mmetsp:Transcript_3171/g.4837  ORF Transcript_3171/g.4837 Transcript_3171/m.4837 type:complete len:102 (-) Transcript_3171:349-654(-)
MKARFSLSPAPAPYNKTKVLKILPRFVVINNLDEPVLVMQEGDESGNAKYVQTIARKEAGLNGNAKEAHFGKPKGESIFIKFRLKGYLWSKKIPIEELDDF